MNKESADTSQGAWRRLGKAAALSLIQILCSDVRMEVDKRVNFTSEEGDLAFLTLDSSRETVIHIIILL
jgi:hypothetical protein